MPVDPHNRLEDVGPAREIDVRIPPSGLAVIRSIAFELLGMDGI